MNMTLSELINEILSEWAYRVNDGMPNPKNPTHIKELGIVLSEMGLSHIKNTLIENLLTEKGKTPEPVVEDEGAFTNPVLNKSIKYKNAKGEDAEGIVGNLLRLPKEHPGRKAAEAMLPPEGSDERDALNKDLGSQGQPQKPEDGKKDGGEEGGGQQEDPIQKAAPMFDPKLDPAMGARLDKEKETLAKIAGDKEEKPAKEEPKKDDGFNPIPANDVQSEIPEADPDTFGGASDIPDGIDKKDLEKFNTDITKVKQIVDDAKAKGEKAPNINLCQITVPGTNLYCDDNLGIPREEMPQFKGKPQPGTPAADMPVDKNGEVDTEPLFKKMLEEKGITVTQTEVPADKLKATQSELVGAKVVGMMGALEENPEHPSITAPIYVSRDGFVIDGHHRWAAIAAYNAAHPDAQIPMKVQVIDMDIKDAIPMCNKFAEEQGVAAKKADANKETPTEQPAEPAKREPANDDPESKAQQFKGKSSGENIQTMEMEGGGFVYGTKHGNTAMVDDILDDVKSKIPKEKWGDIVFVGEGGATNDAGELEFNDEMDYAAPKFKELGASVDTFDGDDLDVHNDQSKLYQKQKEKTGLNDSQIKAGNWASMIGQGEGTDTMSPNDYLDDEGKQFLQDAAKEAGFPPIENWDEPTEQDKDTLYRLSFPEDNGDKPTKINDIQVAFNEIRDENLIEKSKELAAKGKIPITIAGESHVDLVDKMSRKGEEKPEETPTEKLPEPKEPSTEDGGVVYSVGGGYYSDTPGGPAQYRVAEGVVEEVLIEGNESIAYLLFEATVTKKTSRGKVVKLIPIDKSKQKKATAQAKQKAAASKKKKKETQPQPDVEKDSEELDFSKMNAAELKKYVEERIQKNAEDFENAENKDEFAIDFILKRQEEINNNFLRPAGSPASSLGENNGSKYINLIYSKGGKLTPEEEKNILNEIVSSELAQQIPQKDRLRWAKIALETAKTEARVLMFQKKYRAKQPQSQPYPMGVIMDKQSKAMLKNMLEEKLKNAKTPKQRQHYQKQLNYLDKLSESDTGVLYQMENGEIGFKHTSNKSSYKDPHNNTSVDEKIKAITASMGGKIDKGLVKAMKDTSDMVAAASQGIEDAAKKFASGRGSMSDKDRNAQDNIIGKIVSAFPVRGGTKNYLDGIKDKKWFIKKAKELGITIPIESEKDAVTVAIACAADTPPPTAALKVLIKISELLEKITPENIDKTAKAFNISKKELEFLISSASQLKDAAKTRRDVMGEAHTQLVGAIQKADKNQKPPSYPYDKNADNGPHQQAYVEDYLHRMHFTAYIMGERDGVSSQNIGGDNVEPEYYRKCLAELSGYTGELDSEKGRAGLVEHLKKRVRINPKDDSISFVNGKTQKQLGTEVYRTKGESKSVVSGLGVDMQNCLKEKAKAK